MNKGTDMEQGMFRKRLKRREVVNRGFMMAFLVLSVGVVAFNLWYRMLLDYKSLAKFMEHLDGLMAITAMITTCCFFTLAIASFTNFKIAYKKAGDYENSLLVVTKSGESS